MRLSFSRRCWRSRPKLSGAAAECGSRCRPEVASSVMDVVASKSRGPALTP
jgi:hypothetical protein